MLREGKRGITDEQSAWYKCKPQQGCEMQDILSEYLCEVKEHSSKLLRLLKKRFVQQGPKLTERERAWVGVGPMRLEIWSEGWGNES